MVAPRETGNENISEVERCRLSVVRTTSESVNKIFDLEMDKDKLEMRDVDT